MITCARPECKNPVKVGFCSRRCEQEVFALVKGAGIVLVTKGSYGPEVVLLHRRHGHSRDKSSRPGTLEVVGGSVEKPDLSRVDVPFPWSTMIREFREELCIGVNELDLYQMLKQSHVHVLLFKKVCYIVSVLHLENPDFKAVKDFYNGTVSRPETRSIPFGYEIRDRPAIRPEFLDVSVVPLVAIDFSLVKKRERGYLNDPLFKRKAELTLEMKPVDGVVNIFDVVV